jgi:hypothetical protein
MPRNLIAVKFILIFSIVLLFTSLGLAQDKSLILWQLNQIY